MKRYYRFALFVFFSSQYIFTGYSQDINFSQFYQQPLLRNPALAGVFTGDVQITASYRNQWQKVTEHPYRTFALSSEIKLPQVQLFGLEVIPTISLQLLKDVAGTSKFATTQVMPAVTGSIRVAENAFLSLGFIGGLMQQRFDPSALIFNDQFIAGSNGSFSISPYSNQVFNNSSVNYGDVSAGLSYNVVGDNTDYYIGAGLFHILKPSVGFFQYNKITLNRKIALNAGLSTTIDDRNELILYGDYFGKYDDSSFNPVNSTFQTGLMISHNIMQSDEKSITVGLLYRFDDAVIPVFQLELPKLMIGLSYDVNISKLVVASQSRGGVELTFSFKDFFNARNPILQQYRCSFGGHNKRLFHNY